MSGIQGSGSKLTSEEITRADVEALATSEGRPVMEVLSSLQAGAALLNDGEVTLKRLCAIKRLIMRERGL